MKDKEEEESRRLTEKVISEEEGILWREYEEKKSNVTYKMKSDSLWCRGHLIP